MHPAALNMFLDVQRYICDTFFNMFVVWDVDLSCSRETLFFYRDLDLSCFLDVGM